MANFYFLNGKSVSHRHMFKRTPSLQQYRIAARSCTRGQRAKRLPQLRGSYFAMLTDAFNEGYTCAQEQLQMITAEEFRQLHTTDAHNHLNLGMSYDSYVQWAGFYIPDFPRPLAGLGEMHEIIGEYTRPRTKTADDVEHLLSMSIEAAIADHVQELEGSIDIGFINHCGSIDRFLALTDKLHQTYGSRIALRFELGMGKTFDIAKIREWAPPCLESGLFKGIDLYGPEVEEGLEDFVPIYNTAAQLGIKRKAHVGEFSDAHSVERFIEVFNLDEVQHGLGAAQDEHVMQLIKDRNIRLNITPASNVMLKRIARLEDHPMRTLFDAGIRIALGTDDLLFFGRTISEQCADLVNCGLFTKEEVVRMAVQNQPQ